MNRVDFHVNLLPEFARTNVRSSAIPEESPHLRHCFDIEITSALNARCTPQEILAAMKRAGVNKSVVFSYQWLDAERCRLANETVCKAVSANPDELVGLAVVQPRNPASVNALERCLSMPGIVGVKMKPRWGGFALSDLDLMGPICEMLIEKNCILLTHVSQAFHGPTGDQLNNLFALLKAFPRLKVVAAHLGSLAGFYHCYEPFRRHTENLWFDISLPANVDWLPHLMRMGNAEKYLYATDWPYVDYPEFDGLLGRAGLTDKELELIASDNPMRLLASLKSGPA